MVKDVYVFKGHGGELKITRGTMVYFRGEVRTGIYLLKGGNNAHYATISEEGNDTSL